MFWLPVKGPVYWKHTSFPMFGFLSLFLFFPECTAQGLQKGYGASILPGGKQGGGEGDLKSDYLSGGLSTLSLHVGRGLGTEWGDTRSRLGSVTWELWGPGRAQVLSLVSSVKWMGRTKTPLEVFERWQLG